MISNAKHAWILIHPQNTPAPEPVLHAGKKTNLPGYGQAKFLVRISLYFKKSFSGNRFLYLGKNKCGYKFV